MIYGALILLSNLKNKFESFLKRFQTIKNSFFKRNFSHIHKYSSTIIVVIFSLIGIGFGNLDLRSNIFVDVLRSNPNFNQLLYGKLTRPQIVIQNSNSAVNQAQAQEISKIQDQDQSERAPFEYEVRSGDTLTSIAQEYGLKLETILWANDLSAKDIIRSGQTLTLIPTDGVLHTVQKGETIAKIASLHKVSSEKVIEYNNISDPTRIHSGDKIIIPDGVPIPVKRPVPNKSQNQEPGISGSEAGLIIDVPAGKLHWPTTTTLITQGYSASHRGIDISNGSKPPIHAAHDGVVEVATYQTGWGNTIVIRGEDGLVTRYSHASKLEVSPGQSVIAGEEIGIIGNTGNVRGKTGLHLDFRVYRKGIAVNPLPLLK